MTPQEILVALARLDIELSTDLGWLLYRPIASVPRELVAEMLLNRRELIEILENDPERYAILLADYGPSAGGIDQQSPPKPPSKISA